MTTIAAQSPGVRTTAADGARRAGGETPSIFAVLIASGTTGKRIAWALASGLAVAFFALYFRFIDRQMGPRGEFLGFDFGAGSYSLNYFQDWGHAYIVPVVSGAYLWVNRHKIDLSRATTFWPAIPAVAFGSLLYVFFSTWRPVHMMQGVGMLITIGAVTLLLLGPRLFRHLVFPIAYLGLGVTIAEQIMLRITFPLQRLAAEGGHLMLTVFGVDNSLRGNVIDVFLADGTTESLDVAEACSGMRMVVAFVALSVAVAFFSCKQWWQRVAVVLVAVPVAVFMNVIRVAILAGLTLYNPDLAVGEAHTLIGTLLLIPAFFLFMLFVWVFKKATPDADNTKASTP